MNNNGKKDIFTTGQVAQICRVAPRTVTKWFDSGRLKGYRIPGGRDRRIPVAELLRFMKSHNMPTDQLELDKIRILIIDSDWEFAESLAQSLQQNPSFIVETANSGFDAGLIAQKLEPHVILISGGSENIDAAHICKNVRRNPDLQATKLISLGRSSESGPAPDGYDYCIADPADIAQINSVINEAIAIV